jgi:formamidopyrimidine-DNA glycosylase
MPELPEVETMVRGLRPALLGQTLQRLIVHDPHLLQHVDAESLARTAAGARVDSLVRRGKWVVLGLEPPRGFIVIQPRMTGGFWLVTPEKMEHARLTFEIEGSSQRVWFCDTRRLGRVAWYPDDASASAAFGRSHGPDALQISLEDLAARLKRTTRGIKPALMDQKILAGLGNIYADEVLFHAEIHPQYPAHRLKPEQIARIHAAIGLILDQAIRAEGSSFDAGYRTVLGLEGGFLAENAVHRRKGLPCPRCATAIVKTRIDGLIGRPTYYCPACQRPLRRAAKPR